MSDQPTKQKKALGRSDLKELIKRGERILTYEADRLKPAASEALKEEIATSNAALKTKDKGVISSRALAFDEFLNKTHPRKKDYGMRDNVEVFFVAIVIAMAIRTFFLQPFQIPTGSMQPTLYGDVRDDAQNSGAQSVDLLPPEKIPGFAARLWERLFAGRNYVLIKSKTDGAYEGVSQHSIINFGPLNLQYCIIEIGGEKHYFWNSERHLKMLFSPKEKYKKDEIVTSGVLKKGDFVFVDKVTYNFRHPKRGDVFVFLTHGITDIEHSQLARGQMGADFYIKRLVGLENDRLQIRPPFLHVNGEILSANAMFDRIYSLKDGYKGYSNNVNAEGDPSMNNPSVEYVVPEKSFFAMGDNSFHSWDSRGWGAVPEQNVVGKAFVVFYPFSKRLGPIH
ncbi:MAG: signal peptidase I [Verrucomicrobiota bacterium]|nr:signal peptidase I [Verrucomicrobiota bacterium]